MKCFDTQLIHFSPLYQSFIPIAICTNIRLHFFITLAYYDYFHIHFSDWCVRERVRWVFLNLSIHLFYQSQSNHNVMEIWRKRVVLNAVRIHRNKFVQSVSMKMISITLVERQIATVPACFIAKSHQRISSLFNLMTRRHTIRSRWQKVVQTAEPREFFLEWKRLEFNKDSIK